MTHGLFEVCAGWLDGNPVIGRCRILNIRGTETIGFEYDAGWLAANPAFTLGPDVQSDRYIQYPQESGRTFGFLSDTAPDRWGRTLINRMEKEEADKQGRVVRRLSESDYVLRVSDAGRMGGLRYRDPDTGKYLSSDSDDPIPPLAELRALQQAVTNLEGGGASDHWLQMLMAPGSSLGGARPKANVIDESGHLWIAKFPSGNDHHNVGAWEMVEHDLAAKCGIRVAPAKLEHLSEFGDTFLTRRFDRFLQDDHVYRIHIMSAMCALGARDGDSSQHSYLELLEAVERSSADVGADAHELWNRMAFNVMTGNTDDHLRNHAFQMARNGRWRLSPAYDLNPEPGRSWMSLNLDFDDPSKDIRKVLDVAEYFRLSREEANAVIQRMQDVIRQSLGSLCRHYHVSVSEQDRMKPAFSEAFRDI